MPLAEALAPEGVCLAIGQDGFGPHPVNGKQARIPAGRDQCRGAALAGRLVNTLEVFGDACVVIVAVYRAEAGGQVRPLLGKVVARAPAQDEDVKAIAPGVNGVQGMNRYGVVNQFNLRSRPSGKNSSKLHIIGFGNGRLCACSEVAIPDNAHADFFCHLVTCCKHQEKRLLYFVRIKMPAFQPAFSNTANMLQVGSAIAQATALASVTGASTELRIKIGRASCRERVEEAGGADAVEGRRK